MSKRQRDHGERNRKLSHELLAGKVYYDWVVTTAFYSTIHLLENKILPARINGAECKEIADVKRAFQAQGRHQAREILVQHETNMDIAVKYKWLDDKSRFSRYTTYKVDAGVANKAIEYLDKIHSYCCTEE